jgi:hypothetical protein
VAVTNYSDRLKELRELVGRPRQAGWGFAGEQADELLRSRFGSVRHIDAPGTVTFADRDAVLAYVRPSAGLFGGDPDVPHLAGPLVVRRRPVIFIADK